MRDSACRWLIVQYFEVMLNIFEFSHVKKISIGLCKYISMNFSNHVSWPRHSKGKLVPASFSYFLELMREK